MRLTPNRMILESYITAILYLVKHNFDLPPRSLARFPPLPTFYALLGKGKRQQARPSAWNKDDKDCLPRSIRNNPPLTPCPDRLSLHMPDANGSQGLCPLAAKEKTPSLSPLCLNPQPRDTRHGRFQEPPGNSHDTASQAKPEWQPQRAFTLRCAPAGCTRSRKPCNAPRRSCAASTSEARSIGCSVKGLEVDENKMYLKM